MLTSVIAILGLPGVGRAMLLPHWPIDYVVLKSQVIVQGRFIDEKHLFVEKVVLGPATPLSTISINDRMNLTRIANDPERECDPVQERSRFSDKACHNIKQETAIVFLQDVNGSWEPTGWGSGVKWFVNGRVLGYYQFDNPGPYVLIPDQESKTVEDLNAALARALEKRSRFDAALSKKDPKQRIDGLMPFVEDPKTDLYWRDAVHALAATGPEAGAALRDLAQKLRSKYARIEVLRAIGETTDKDSSAYLSQVVAAAKPVLRDFGLELPSADERQAVEEWLASLCSIAMLADRGRLPVLRKSLFDTFNVGEFYGSQARTCVEIGFQKSPAAENLVPFAKAYELYPKWYKWEGATKWASWGSLNFLVEHKFKEAIPLLVEQLDHPDLSSRDLCHRLLTEIVGRDLGDRGEPWLEWYRQYERTKRSGAVEVRH